MSEPIVMTEINPPETSRTYTFPSGEITISSVTHFHCRPSGTHRLKTSDGKLHIVPTGWLHIAIDGVSDWTL